MGAVVGEMLASALLRVVAGKLGAAIASEVSSRGRCRGDLESMRSTLAALQAVLHDAERRSSREERVRLWVRRLKSAVYDIEDMLAEFDTDNAPTPNDGLLRKVAQFHPSLSVSHDSLSHKLKKMRQRLDKIKDEANIGIFNFKVDICSIDEEVSTQATFSAISEDTVGRDADKETIVSMLTTYSEEVISTISIYGFGGIGKTTLARLAFNHKNVERAFDYRVWVYVSMKFDLKKVGESIISEIEAGGCSYATLQDVNRHLARVLDGKKFLVVLDDLWEENGCRLEILKAMLKVGAKGSKVIVTTRSEKVARLMGPGPPGISYKLDVLSDDDCWILFEQRAFLHGRRDPRLEEIGRDIVKKCKGVPLSAISLGFVMRFKEGVAAWAAMRDSEIWEMEEDQNILPSLKLSYYNLPPHLRLCFAYCAVFPKGSVLDKDMLIQQWIALGLIQTPQGSLTLEKQGEEYVKELVSMSFLQVSATSSLVRRHHMKDVRVFQMHGLVSDLARCVAGEEFFLLDAKKSHSKYAGNTDYRYVVVMNYSEMPTSTKNVLSKTRALHFKDCKELKISGKSSSFGKSLRVLDLSGCSVLELPSQINQMKQLQYLDASGMQKQLKHEYLISLRSLRTLKLSGSSVQALPVQIGNLAKLRYLNLHGCSHLMSIPESLGELMDLLHLDLSGCSNIQVLPTSLGQLHKLSFLDLSGCFNLCILPESFCNLRYLEDLNLSSCHKLRELDEIFSNLQQLLILDMSGCQKLCIVPKSICSALRLVDLNLSCFFQLQKLPKDFGKLGQLRILDLGDCHKLQTLPESFTDLLNLEKLILSDCWELRELPESLGNLHKVFFLDISCCSQLFALPESLTRLTNLEHLNLSCCMSLEEMPGYYGNLRKLETLNISHCLKVQIPHGIADIRSLRNLLVLGLHLYGNQNLKGISHLTSSMNMPTISFARKVKPHNYFLLHTKLHLQGLSNVRNLRVVERFALRRQQQLISLRLSGHHLDGPPSGHYLIVRPDTKTAPYDVVLEKLLPPRTLEHLELLGYKGAKLPSWMLNVASILPNLVHLKLSGLAMCDHLPPLGQLPKLQSLDIADIPNIHKVGTDFAGGSRPFLKLRDLIISDMLNLESWLTTLSTNNVENKCVFPNLHHLKVARCPMLRFDPTLPKCLSLEIDKCHELLLEQPKVPSLPTSIRRISIQSCVLSSSGWYVLQRFTSLKFLSLGSCEGLSTWSESTGVLSSLEKLELLYSDPPGCLGSILSLRSLEIVMCHLPRLFPQQLLQLSSLEKLLINSCSFEFEKLPGEVSQEILTHIPDVKIYDVGYIRCVEQKSGILCICQIGSSNQVTSDTTSNANWNAQTTKIFCELCANEVLAGNRSSSHLNNVGIRNLIAKMNDITKRCYGRKQLKNKWEALKKDYRIWKALVASESGFGWDPIKNTVLASDKWWEEKKKALPGCEKFRTRPLLNIELLATMFDIILDSNQGIGSRSVHVQANGDATTPGGKRLRKKHKARATADNRGNKHFFEVVLRRIQVLSITSRRVGPKYRSACNTGERNCGAKPVTTSRRVDPQNCSISEVMKLVCQAGVDIGSDEYFVASQLFVKQEYREMFLTFETPEQRAVWLTRIWKQRKGLH